MANLGIYLVGVLVVVCGAGYGAHLLGVSSTWIGVGAAIVVGLGIMGAVSKTQKRE